MEPHEFQLKTGYTLTIVKKRIETEAGLQQF